MKVHEHQARELLESYGVPVPAGRTVETGDAAAAAYDEITRAEGVELAVVKAQVHAGGRGKAGGVQLVRSREDARKAAAGMLEKPLVTAQTGPEGVPVNKVLISAGVEIEQEYYLAIAVDRARACPVLIASAEGGVEIEEVAANNPDAILREPLDPEAGLRSFQARKIAFGLGFRGKTVKAAVDLMQKLTRLFLENDASLAEINPLVRTPATEARPEGAVLAIDAKLSFDDNALPGHPAIEALYDPTEEDETEQRARTHRLNYIQLDGTIGCLVNGAGLAMATMDLVKHNGGEPANFLDVGGGASEEAVTEAFSIILSDEQVRGVLVNIFGGIMKCDIIAKAIVNAAEQVGFSVPLIVRLEGTNVEAAREILQEARAAIPVLETAVDLNDAAAKVAAAAGAAA